MELPVNVLFHGLISAGVLTEDLWKLQLVSRECRDLYRRYVQYRSLIPKTIQRKYRLVGAERLDREGSLDLIRRQGSTSYIAPFLQMGLITAGTIRELLLQDVFSCFTDREFRLVCRTQGFRPSVYIMCLHACNQNAWAEFNCVIDYGNCRHDPSLWLRVRRANRYFRALGRIPLYLQHLASIAVRPRSLDIPPLRVRINKILELSIIRNWAMRDRTRALVTIYLLAREWYDQEIGRCGNSGPDISHRLWLQSCSI